MAESSRRPIIWKRRPARARYQALDELRNELGLSAVLTAHTADDQAETLLMRLAKGSGLRGLRGILPVFGQVVRPWLAVERQSVQSWARSIGMDWCEDPTNLDPRFKRNDLRRRVMPSLVDAFGQSFLRNASRSAHRLASTEEALEMLMEPLMSTCIDWADGGCRLNVEQIRTFRRPLRLEVIYRALGHALKRYGVFGLNRQETQVLSLDEMVLKDSQGQTLDLGYGWTAWRSKQFLEIRTPVAEFDQPPNIRVTPSESYIRTVVRCDNRWSHHVQGAGRGTSLARQPLSWASRRSLTIIFTALGAPGRRRAARVLMDAGIPAIERSSSPVIVRNDQVLALAENPSQ